MENVFQNLLKNNSLLSRSGENINILAEEGDNPLYGIFNKDMSFGYISAGNENVWAPLIRVQSIQQLVLIIRNSTEHPDALVKISNNGIDWEEVIGWQKASEVDSSVLTGDEIGPYIQLGYISSDTVYTTNINFHDWTEGYISIEYAKTGNNSNGSSEKFNIIPVQNLTFLKNDILYKEGLILLENSLQRRSNNNYTAKVWKNNDIIDLYRVNNWENTAEQYGFNYIKQSWNENDEITADKLNHLKDFFKIEIGEEIVKDGITSVCIYDAGFEQEWGRYIFVDKSHDLSYYILGSDYVDSDDYNTSPGTYGYEWGGYKISTGITSESIGDGLSNTNSLIEMNLQPYTSGWRVLWDCVEEFRSSHSDDWFVPSYNELREVHDQRSYLENISTSTNYYYWCSSEFEPMQAERFYFNGGKTVSDSYDKRGHYIRSRLCWYL